MEIKDIIENFDEWLLREGQTFEATIVGGAALVLLNVISRATQDVDILDDEILPETILQLAHAFARHHSIPENWLNNDVSPLKSDLPPNWENRRIEVFRGRAIRFLTLGRTDLLKAKLWALCDRARDFEDVLAMKPTESELFEARAWLNPLDGNPGWVEHVEKTLHEVASALSSRASDE